MRYIKFLLPLKIDVLIKLLLIINLIYSSVVQTGITDWLPNAIEPGNGKSIGGMSFEKRGINDSRQVHFGAHRRRLSAMFEPPEREILFI